MTAVKHSIVYLPLHAAAFSTAGKQHARSAVHYVLNNNKASSTAAALFAAGVAIGEYCHTQMCSC